MSTQFSRTTRSLAADTSSLAWVTWLLAVLLLFAWSTWFVQGRVTVYEVSDAARLEASQGGWTVVANFSPASALVRMRPGQRGRMHLDGFQWAETDGIDVVVQSVDAEVRDQRVRVELRPLPSQKVSELLKPGLRGVVEIAVEQISPARLALRAIGQVSSDGALVGSTAGIEKP